MMKNLWLWRRLLPVALLLSLAPVISAQPRFRVPEDKFAIDSAHSSVSFSVGFMGLTDVEGRFKNYWGTILYDEQDLTRSTISVAIRAESIDTGNDSRDRHLKSADFFDAAKYPIIFFQSKRVERQGDSFVVTGDLTLHGVTKEVAIPFRHLHGRTKDMWENTRVGFLGKLKLDRREFAIVGPQNWERVLDLGRLIIGHEVTITLNVQGRILNMERISLGEKSAARAVQQTVAERGVEPAIAQYRELKQKQPDAYDFHPRWLNFLGYKLLQERKIREAIEIFKLNVEAVPENADVHNSLADGYAAAAQWEQALEHYKKAVALDPYITSSFEMVRLLSANPEISQ